MAALHANTVEAPVYWEQLEPQQGHFDFANVDQVVEGARAHGLHQHISSRRRLHRTCVHGTPRRPRHQPVQQRVLRPAAHDVNGANAAAG